MFDIWINFMVKERNATIIPATFCVLHMKPIKNLHNVAINTVIMKLVNGFLVPFYSKSFLSSKKNVIRVAR